MRNPIRKHDKETIINRALTHAFAQREEGIAQKRVELAEAIYKHLYTPEMQKMMNDAPEGAFKKCAEIRCNFHGERDWLPFKDIKPIFYKNDNSPVRFEFDSPFTERFLEISKEKKNLSEEKNSAQNNIQAILNSARTFKRLLEMWPECEMFLKDLPGAKKEMLPAVCIHDLNTMLKLPAQEQTQGAAT